MKRKNQTSILQFSKKREKSKIEFLTEPIDDKIEKEMDGKVLSSGMEKENESM